MHTPYHSPPEKSSAKRPRHEHAYATDDPLVQRRRSLKRWYGSGGEHEQRRLSYRQNRAFELRMAGLSFREIAAALHYRGHGHLHRLIQEDRDRLALMARFGDGWSKMRDVWDLFEDAYPEGPETFPGERCSLPNWGRGEVPGKGEALQLLPTSTQGAAARAGPLC